MDSTKILARCHGFSARAASWFQSHRQSSLGIDPYKTTKNPSNRQAKSGDAAQKARKREQDESELYNVDLDRLAALGPVGGVTCRSGIWGRIERVLATRRCL
jgi:hypothetical protein